MSTGTEFVCALSAVWVGSELVFVHDGEAALESFGGTVFVVAESVDTGVFHGVADGIAVLVCRGLDRIVVFGDGMGDVEF